MLPMSQTALNNKKFCTSCQADRPIDGGQLTPYKTGGFMRSRWKCIFCVQKVGVSRFSKVVDQKAHDQS